MKEEEIVIGRRYKNSLWPGTVYLGTGYYNRLVDTDLVVIESDDPSTIGRKCLKLGIEPSLYMVNFWNSFYPVTPRKRKQKSRIK